MVYPFRPPGSTCAGGSRRHVKGLVIKAHSGFFTVQAEDGAEYVCQTAGRLKKGRHVEDAVAIGDRVEVEAVKSDGFSNGRILSVEARRHSLSRLDPIISQKEKLERRQVIVANVDVVGFVFSCAHPDFHSRMLDRYLVGAEAQGLQAVIVANKVDLVGLTRAREMFADYERIGYRLIYTSVSGSHQGGLNVPKGLGIEDLRRELHGKLSVLTGKSGVGKSSLLNALRPGLALDVGEVSQMWRKGKHTTVVPELVRMDGESWIADTPGLRAYAIWDVQAEELDAYYREMAPLVRHCAFNDCTHTHEQGCAVAAAVERGAVSRDRYESYCRLREELSRQRAW